jgi:hypothetical protein
MPTLISVNGPPVSGFVAGVQPKIANAQPSGTYTSPPQVMPVVNIWQNYLGLLHLLDSNTRIGDVITYYIYPIPSLGALIQLCQITLTTTNLKRYITGGREHFCEEAFYNFPTRGTYEIYYDHTNSSGSYTILSQNLRFLHQ